MGTAAGGCGTPGRMAPRVRCRGAPAALRPISERFGDAWQSFRLVTWILELPLRMAAEGCPPTGRHWIKDQYAWAYEKNEFTHDIREFTQLLITAYRAVHDPDE